MTRSDSAPDRIAVNDRLDIPLSEIVIRATRGGGPGGQHVNKTSTRVEASWSIATSRALRAEDRTRLLEKLASRLDASGTLRIVSAETRSQLQNRDRALARLGETVRAALIVPKARRKTRPTRAAKEERIETKKRRSATKRDRRWSGDD